MTSIFPELYQFSAYIPPIDLSFHQYLLLSDEPLLVHTGNAAQAERIVPEIHTLLAGRSLKYVFASHFESDECGGIEIIARAFPEATLVCSSLTAREVSGFGFSIPTLVKKGGDSFKAGNGDFLCIAYPSETHLENGLLLFERTRGLFFSSDLMFKFGEGHGKIIEGDWKNEVVSFDHTQVPNVEMLGRFKNDLLNIEPVFVATGHGSCIRMVTKNP
ncbi:MAG: hypothetical protein LUE17_04980 [Planctomycetaceae bacterium]|nr:hypothetical protein [Planctomycetaceae bacterium]